MKKQLPLLIALTIFSSAGLMGQQLSPNEDSLFRFYLNIIKIELTEGNKAHIKYPSMYYVAHIDTNYNDTLYKNIYLEDAVRFLEFRTNIYIRRGKFGGFILTPDIYNRWKNWYLERSGTDDTAHL